MSSELNGFGDAIREIEVHVYVEGGIASRNLYPIPQQYHEFTANLPRTKFYRKKKRFQIEYVSSLDLASASIFLEPRLDIFSVVIFEIAEQFRLIKDKLKKTDDFRYEEFEQSIKRKLELIPSNDSAFLAMVQQFNLAREQRFAEMDEWQKLGIDWDDFHPDAKAILDDPFYWQAADDFAPHGNDNGADVLAIYQQKSPTVNHGSALQIVNEILVEWGLSSADNEPEDNGFKEYCEIVLGVAFAQIKYQARCDVEMRNMALDVIQRSKTLHKKSYADWPLLQEKIDSLDMMAGKVNSMNNP